MEKSLKNEIVKAAEAVKKKVKMMREIENDHERVLETVFKPITNPLNHMVGSRKNISNQNRDKTLQVDSSFDSCNGTLANTKEEEEDTLQSSNEESDSEFDITDNILTDDSSFQSSNSNDDLTKNSSSWSTSPEIFRNVLYGLRNDKGKLMLGTSQVKYNDNIISIANRNYKLTDGIKELLFRQNLDLSKVTEDDLENYKLMLLDTNAHRRKFNPNKPIKSNKGEKYLKVIKPLFNLKKGSENTCINLSQGSGIAIKKRLKRNCDYVYWNDPNELVERLKLLMASKNAGNTGLDNEIISIIEELRESGIISC